MVMEGEDSHHIGHTWSYK